MKNITFFYISALKNASNFYQYRASGESEEVLHILPLDTFSRPDRGDNRKMVEKVGSSKIYLQKIKVYLMEMKVIIDFLTEYRFYIIFYKIIGFLIFALAHKKIEL